MTLQASRTALQQLRAGRG